MSTQPEPLSPALPEPLPSAAEANAALRAYAADRTVWTPAALAELDRLRTVWTQAARREVVRAA